MFFGGFLSIQYASMQLLGQQGPQVMKGGLAVFWEPLFSLPSFGKGGGNTEDPYRE